MQMFSVVSSDNHVTSVCLLTDFSVSQDQIQAFNYSIHCEHPNARVPAESVFPLILLCSSQLVLLTAFVTLTSRVSPQRLLPVIFIVIFMTFLLYQIVCRREEMGGLFERGCELWEIHFLAHNISTTQCAFCHNNTPRGPYQFELYCSTHTKRCPEPLQET